MLIDAQINGVSEFKVSSTGATTIKGSTSGIGLMLSTLSTTSGVATLVMGNEPSGDTSGAALVINPASATYAGNLADMQVNGTSKFTVAAGGTVTLANALTVANGGTGESSLTAYGLIAGGTTSTSTTQVIAPGTTNYVLVGEGPASLPQWLVASGLSTANINSVGTGHVYHHQGARIAGSSITSNCTGTCTVYGPDIAWISGVTRTATGQYTVNFTSGTFTTTPFCLAGGADTNGATSVIMAINYNAISSTSVGLFTTNYSGSYADGSVNFICEGY
jgi:hypothetical protein